MMSEGWERLNGSTVQQTTCIISPFFEVNLGSRELDDYYLMVCEKHSSIQGISTKGYKSMAVYSEN